MSRPVRDLQRTPSLGDLTILESDPVTAAPQHLGTIGVTQTWIGGTLRYERP